MFYTLFDESGTARAQTLGTGPSLFLAVLAIVMEKRRRTCVHI